MVHLPRLAPARAAGQVSLCLSACSYWASSVKKGQLPEGAAGGASAKSGASAGKSGGAGEAGTMRLFLLAWL